MGHEDRRRRVDQLETRIPFPPDTESVHNAWLDSLSEDELVFMIAVMDGSIGIDEARSRFEVLNEGFAAIHEARLGRRAYLSLKRADELNCDPR